MTLVLWAVFGVVLAGGIAACVYWLRVANREWALYEELLIGQPKERK